jgi:hypothetical protein
MICVCVCTVIRVEYWSPSTILSLSPSLFLSLSLCFVCVYRKASGASKQASKHASGARARANLGGGPKATEGGHNLCHGMISFFFICSLVFVLGGSDVVAVARPLPLPRSPSCCSSASLARCLFVSLPPLSLCLPASNCVPKHTDTYTHTHAHMRARTTLSLSLASHRQTERKRERESERERAREKKREKREKEREGESERERDRGCQRRCLQLYIPPQDY